MAAVNQNRFLNGEVVELHERIKLQSIMWAFYLLKWKTFNYLQKVLQEITPPSCYSFKMSETVLYFIQRYKR